MPIKLGACVTFPTELTTDDIIDDITNGDPADLMFVRFGESSNGEFETLCKQVDERARLNRVYQSVKNDISVLNEKL